MAIAFVAANPKPKADPKADPQILTPVVASAYPSNYVYERSYHGNLAYPYVSAPLIAASPYAAYSAAPILFR